jgi:hypothetical protein
MVDSSLAVSNVQAWLTVVGVLILAAVVLVRFLTGR